MCIPCAQSGAKDPNYDPKIAGAESDLFWGRAMIAGAVVFMLALIFVPSREGAPPRNKVFLWSSALGLFAAGMAKAGAARSELAKLKESKPNQTSRPTPGR